MGKRLRRVVWLDQLVKKAWLKVLKKPVGGPELGQQFGLHRSRIELARQRRQ